MVQYRGVSAEDIADSIQAAKVFVIELGCDKVIEDYVCAITADEVSAVREAVSTEQLAKAIQRPYGIFLFMADLFIRHGILDTNGTGADVARNLFAWGAFDGQRTLDETETDRAIEGHLKDYPEPAAEQYEAFYASLAPSYIEHYGIVCDLKDQEKIRKIHNAVGAALGPFYAKGEVGIIGIGMIGDERLKGVFFETSLDGAKAVAAAVPGHEVRDYSGNVVGTPSADGQNQKPEDPAPV